MLASALCEHKDLWVHFGRLKLALAIMVFDTLLTLPLEIQFVWREKFSLPSFLYILGRYANILSVLVDLISNHVVFDLQVGTLFCSLLFLY